ncbi:nuclear pore complex protein Nup214-like isoform X2 [Bolinopsis microptera]|uniref:nuclear pore complex protein Nup214-like isoform X2 n=1 Tax=Bolinopsis microptera TaxID=2820187 RepID=UPI00307A8D53
MEHECEVKHFQFKFLPKIIVGKQTDVERGQLISSTKFGHIIVSQSNEVTVYKKVDIHNIFDKEKASACVGAPHPVSVMSFDTKVTHLTVSCDDTMLGVVTEDNKISLVDVRTLNSDPAVFSQASLSAKCAGLMWNPGIPTLLATATVTGEVTVWEVRVDSIVQASTKQTFGASSLCWSSKGKQLAVGTNDGKIFNLKPTLDEARCTQNPPLFNAPALVRDIFWISTFEYVAVYESSDVIKIVHVQNQKDKKIPTKFTDFDDIFYSEPGRAISVLMSQILPWSTLVLGCSRGMELGVIGEPPGKKGQFLFNLDEGSRAEMPFQDGEPSYPVGMCVDYNYNKPTVIGEKSIPPSPVLFTLTSEGVICSFKLLNYTAADTLVTPLEAPSLAPPSRTKSIVNVKKLPSAAPVSAAPFNTAPPAAAPPSAVSAKPSLFNAPAPFPSLGAPSLASTPAAAPSLPSFAAPNPAPKLAPTPSLAPSFGESKPAAPVFTKPEIPKNPVVNLVKEPLSRKPSLPIVNKAVEKPVAVDKKKDSQENQANLDSIFAKSIDDEVLNFSHQIEQHKASSKRLDDVKDILSKDELKEFGNKVIALEKKLSKVHSTLHTVNKDVSGEKDTLLVALASLEEAKGYYNCYNDPSYIALLKSKPLDKMTRKLKDDLFSKFAQMQNLIDELNIQLDTEWENMHSNKKTTPTSRMIYKTLSQHRTISNEQEKTIDTLLKQLGNVTLKPREASPSPNKSVITKTKTISPQKQKMLRGIFQNRLPTSKIVTSPAKMNISSFSASYAKPPALPPMSENSEPEDNEAEKENLNLNSSISGKPEPLKFGIPSLQYSEKPKFDVDDPTRLLGGEEKVPTVVLKYMPSTPQVLPSAEEKAKGAQELVSKLMDFAQKEKDSGTGNADATFAQMFVPVMRTKGPVAPGQAPNAVIQPVSTVKDTGLQEPVSTVPKSGGLFTAPASGTPFSLGSGSSQTSSLFGLPKTQSTSPQPSGLFSFTSSKPQSVTKTPVVDAKTMFGAQPNAQSTGSLFAPVSTPPLNAAQIGAKSTPILVTPKATTPPTTNIFGTLKPAAEPPKSPGGDFPVFGVPASQFDKERESPSAGLPDYNESSEESSTTSLTSSTTEANNGATVDVESTEQENVVQEKAEPKEAPNIFNSDNSPAKPAPSFGSSTGSPKNLFAAAPSSGNIFAMANSSSPSSNIFTSSSSSGNMFGGSGGSTVGFFAPVSKAADDQKKGSSPSIGGSLVSSQEKSPATPPQAAAVTAATPPQAAAVAAVPAPETTTTPQPSDNLFTTGVKDEEKPTSVKNLFGSDSKENEGESEGGLFSLKISSDDTKSSTSPKNPFGLLETKSAAPESGGLFGSMPATGTSSPFTSNLFAKPATTGLFSSAPASTVSSGNIFTAASSATTPAGGGGGGGGLFGSTTTTSSSGGLFGSTTSTATSTTPAASSGLFGTPVASTPSSGLFGSTAAITPSSTGLFGSTAPSTGLFGAAPSAAAPAAASPFGGASTTTTGSGLFGAAPSAQPGSVFGGGGTAGGGFGGAANSTTAGGFGGGNTNMFGNTQAQSGFGSTTTSSGFGGTNDLNSGQSAFGTAPAFGSTPSFGTEPAFGSTPSFGAPGGFGAPAASSFGTQPTFGGQATGGGSVFGSSSGSVFGGGGGGGPSFGAVAATGGGIFGGNQQNPAAPPAGGGGIFGGNNNQAAPTGFGAANNQSSGGFLGNTNQNNNNNSFGSKPSSFGGWR